jgi:hypothetical protein
VITRQTPASCREDGVRIGVGARQHLEVPRFQDPETSAIAIPSSRAHVKHLLSRSTYLRTGIHPRIKSEGMLRLKTL